MSSGRVNIVLINCDDLGYGDLGCYGSTANRTPALDRLASEGVRLTNFYMSSSICTPSRAALLTGCYHQRISMNRVLFPGDPEGLHLQEETLAAMLQREGYATALVGKWHLGDQPEFLPRRFGFDRYYGIPFSNDMGRQVGDPKDKAPLPLIRDDEVIEEQPDQSGLTFRYVDESVRFMRDCAAARQPFFLYLAHLYVHIPLYVPDRFLRESTNGRYGGAVACIDWAWDRLDHELKRLGLAENTVVIFTSDNGSRTNGEGGSNAPLRGAKFSTWEGGFRVPCMVRRPEHIRAASVCEGMASSLDLLATVAAWTGATRQSPMPMDGVDLGPLLTGAVQTSPRETFAYFANGHLAALRNGRWKLHFCMRDSWNDPVDAFSALYDLEEDPGEQRDVCASHPGIVAELSARAEVFREELGDAFTKRSGRAVRPCGRARDPRPLTVHDPTHPYVVAEYDLADRG